MTRNQLNKLTIPQLRDLCRKASLPVWQIDGHRLCKCDLVSALARHGRRKAKPRKKPARKPKARQAAPQPRETGIVDAMAEWMILRTEADLPLDPGYSAVMRRVMVRGEAASPKDLRKIDRRRRASIAVLADHDDVRIRRYFGAILAAYPSV